MSHFLRFEDLFLLSKPGGFANLSPKLPLYMAIYLPLSPTHSSASPPFFANQQKAF